MPAWTKIAEGIPVFRQVMAETPVDEAVDRRSMGYIMGIRYTLPL